MPHKTERPWKLLHPRAHKKASDQTGNMSTTLPCHRSAVKKYLSIISTKPTPYPRTPCVSAGQMVHAGPNAAGPFWRPINRGRLLRGSSGLLQGLF